MYTLFILSKSSLVIFISSNLILPFSSNLLINVSSTPFGCSYISFVIKQSYPPFDAASISQFISFIFFSTTFLFSSNIVTFGPCICTYSSFSKKITSLVYFNMAGISDAMKFSSSPTPTIRGLSFLTATNSLLLSLQTTPKA